MEIRRLLSDETSDFTALLEIFKEVFGHPDRTPEMPHLSRLLASPTFVVLVARVDNTVIGGLTIHILPQYYSPRSLAYIYDVGIAPGFQGKGAGKALIREACSFCRAHGFHEAFVQAAGDDIDAQHFYRKTPITAEMNAVQFTYSFSGQH